MRIWSNLPFVYVYYKSLIIVFKHFRKKKMSEWHVLKISIIYTLAYPQFHSEDFNE